MATTGVAPSVGNWRVGTFFALAAAAAIWAAFHQIHTLVTGQDPRTFIVLGRQIAEQNFSLAAIREVARFVIPGYPVCLASVIRLFGIEAAFRVNSVLLLGTIVLLNRLFFRLMKNEWQAGFMALFCLTGLFAGYSRNAHFLLLAFRNTPTYLCMVAAMACAWQAFACAGRRSLCMAAGAGLCILAGTAIRETVILMAPVLALFILSGPREPQPPSRRRELMAFLLPFAVVGAGAFAVVLHDGDALLNSQSRQLLRILPTFLDFSGNLQSFWKMLGFIRDEFGVGGLALLMIGLWHARKTKAFLYLFLLPAFLYFLFDGAIKVHLRFFLTTFFFLLPIAALGAAVLLEGLQRRLCRIHLRNPRWVALPAAALLALWCAHAVAALDVWGVKVTSNEIQAMTAALDREAAGEEALLVDRRTRFLVDALTVFTRFKPVNAAEPDLPLVRTPPRIFVGPRNQAAIYTLDLGLEGRIAIQRQGRVEWTGARFRLGDGEYEVARVLPWEHRKVEQNLPPPPAYPAVLRITAPRLRDPASGRTFIRMRVDDQVVMDHMEMGANYVVIDRLPPGPFHRMEIESDAPVPDDFSPAWRRLDEPLHMDFGEMEDPSHDHYLSADFFAFPSPKPDVVELPSVGSIELPVRYPSNTYLMAILGASTVHDEPALTAEVVVSSDGRELARASMPTTWRMTPMLMHLGLMGDPPITHLLLRFQRKGNFRRPPADAHGWNYEVHNLALYPVLLGARLRVDIGATGDAPFLIGGFWAREQSPEGTGRWTKERAKLNLPLQPGTAYQVHLQFQTNRPPAAPTADLALAFNGRSLEFEREPAGTSLRARIPASWVAGPSNVLEIAVTPWRPCDYLKTRDDRTLGIFLLRMDVLPERSVATAENP